MKQISIAQWQKINAGIFVYEIGDNSPFEGRFAVRTMIGRSNVNYNDFRELPAALNRAEKINEQFPNLLVYRVGLSDYDENGVPKGVIRGKGNYLG